MQTKPAAPSEGATNPTIFFAFQIFHTALLCCCHYNIGPLALFCCHFHFFAVTFTVLLQLSLFCCDFYRFAATFTCLLPLSLFPSHFHFLLWLSLFCCDIYKSSTASHCCCRFNIVPLALSCYQFHVFPATFTFLMRGSLFCCHSYFFAATFTFLLTLSHCSSITMSPLLKTGQGCSLLSCYLSVDNPL